MSEDDLHCLCALYDTSYDSYTVTSLCIVSVLSPFTQKCVLLVTSFTFELRCAEFVCFHMYLPERGKFLRSP